MKSKSVLLLCLGLLLALCVTNAFSQASPDDALIENTDHIDAPIAQNVDNNGNAYPHLYPPYQQMEQDAYKEYGLLGFMVVACMSLVMFVVKSDRKSITDLTEAINSHASATMELVTVHESEIQLLRVELSSKMDNIQKDLDRRTPQA